MNQTSMQNVQNHLSFVNQQIGALQARIQAQGFVSPQNAQMMAKLENDRDMYRNILKQNS